MAAKTGTYTLINSTTLSTAAASVTFSSIPGTYTDLVLVITGKGTGGDGDTNLYLQFNGDTGSNYSATRIKGDGSSATSARITSQTSIASNPAWYLRSSTDYVGIINIQDYSNSSTYKTVLSRHNNNGQAVLAEVGLWRSTSAITSVVASTGPNNFATGSTFKLYGIEAGNL